ncbi:MAG: Holliday junction resolvase RuvX [Bacillota bacterium]|nr:Holliday junction resolvase RuvX [Bacillota bacterium]
MDPGSKRVGLALADQQGVAVRPLPPAPAGSGLAHVARSIAALVAEYEVCEIVVGLPRNMDGSEGPAAAQARRLAKLIGNLLPGVNVALWDERLTTVMAEKTLLAADLSRRKRKQLIDSQSAAVLVVDYLRAGARPGAGNQAGGSPPRMDKG